MKQSNKSPNQRRETGAIRKSWAGRTRVALVYPNTYAVGMASLGFQTVYGLMNALDDVVCERAFPPDARDRRGLRTEESGRPLADADIVAFSLSFESDYPHILDILDAAGLPLLSADRDERHPLVVAGGVAAMLNPEPVAAFIDAFFIGEAEPMLADFFARFDPEADREDLLRTLAREVPGIYVPGAYEVRYGAAGEVLEMIPRSGFPERIRRRYLAELDDTETRTVVMSGDTALGGASLVEVSRGCPHGCRFCGAGFVYRPPRFRGLEAIAAQVERAKSDGASQVGLLGAAVSDLPDLEPLCARFAGDDGLRFSFSSLRADALTPSLVEALLHANLKTATIAPEAGGERMRRVMNKGITEADILGAARRLVTAGIPHLKLYFMIGLPTETDADAAEIADLCEAVREAFLAASRERGYIGELVVSLNSFVPKPFTPFQWAGMAPVEELRNRVRTLKRRIGKLPNVKFHPDEPRHAFIQALLSRGDRRLADLLLRLRENRGNWPQTLKHSPVPPEFYVTRTRGRAEVFPWEIIDHGVARDFLWMEYQRALAEKPSPDCRPGTGCRRCGVCG